MTVRRDDELAMAAAAGDEPAFREIIERYATSIYDFATRSSGDFRTGLTTTLAVFEEVPKPNPSVRAALFRKARELLSELPEVSERSSVWGSLPHRPWPEAEEVTALVAEAQYVWSAARLLDLNTYMTFDLDTQRGLSSEELAAVLGISKGHAATAAARAREAVRTAIATRMLLAGDGCDDLAPLAESSHLVQKHLVGCKSCQAARADLALPGMTLPVFVELEPPADFLEGLGKGVVPPPPQKKRRRPRLFITSVAVGLFALVAAAAIAAPLLLADDQKNPVVTTSVVPMSPTTTLDVPSQTTMLSAIGSALPAVEMATTVPPSTTTSVPFASFPFPTSPANGEDTTTTTTKTPAVTSSTSPPRTSATTTSVATTSTTTATTTTVASTTSTTVATTTSTTTTSTTAPPNDPPEPVIAWPLAGAKVCEGRVVNFSGSASDPEGHAIAAYAWTSSLDGTFAGGSTAASALSVGTHTITFSATDSIGATGNTSINVQVQPSTAPAC